jgi:CheY-like chemotaxis protein
MGMDKATMGRIFEPFFTTRERGVGTGLGLASVYNIVKNHEGFLEVDSTVNAGTTFAVYLPASQRRIQEDEQESGAPEHGEETILLVDDEQLVREVEENMLRSLGYKVLCASGGGEAIDLYARMKDRIGLVVLDMVMPGLGGYETFERLQEMDPAAKVLLASGYSLNGRAQDIMARGCRGFIQKPFGVKEISKKIREILDDDA